jgi:general secretion pathway protein J
MRRSAYCRGHSERGFGLAEALVAIAILVMIAGLSFGTFARVLDSRDRATAITDRYHDVRQALLRMTREISTAFLSMHKDCADPRTATIFATRRVATGARLDFTSFSHFKTVADANESDQNELSYFIEADRDDGSKKNLMRREQARIDENPEEGGAAQVLAENVESLEFSFYDAKADQWRDEWDSRGPDSRNRLPKFVKITLKVKDDADRELVFITKTRVFMRDAINITGSGFSPCIE